MLNWLRQWTKFKKIEPTPTEAFYTSLNYAFKNKVPVLEYFISNFEPQDFKALCKDLDRQGFNLSMACRDDHEFLIIELKDYQGPRDQPIKPLVITRPRKPKAVTKPKTTPPAPKPALFKEEPKVTPKPTQNPPNVISVDFRTRRKVS